VGEGKALLGFIGQMSRYWKEEKYYLLITVTSAKGCERLLDYLSAYKQIYPHLFKTHVFNIQIAPGYHSRILKKWVEFYRPQALVFYENDIWWPYLEIARINQFPIYWCAALNPRPSFFKGLYLNVLVKNFSCIDAQSSSFFGFFSKVKGQRQINTKIPPQRKYTTSLQANPTSPLSPTKLSDHINKSMVNCRVGGDYKAFLPNIKTVEAYPKQFFSFISIHKAEVEIVMSWYRHFRPPFPLLFVPRHQKEQFEILNLLKPEGVKIVSFSNDPKDKVLGYTYINPLKKDQKPGLYISLDWGKIPETLACSLGMFMGGSLTRHGGHNIWEALAAGVIPAWGPSFWLQNAAVDFVNKRGVGISIRSIECWSHLPHKLKEQQHFSAKLPQMLEEYRNSLQAGVEIWSRLPQVNFNNSELQP